MNSTERPDNVKDSLKNGEPMNATTPTDAAPIVETSAVVAPKTDTSHTLKVVRFETLARCGDEIWIENEGQIYRLRRTRQGKLILTK